MMDGSDWTELAEVLLDSLVITDQHGMSFEEDHGSSWTVNARVGYRQAVIRAKLEKHPRLGVVKDRASDFGCIRVQPPDGTAPFLLKPYGYLRPSTDPENGDQRPFFSDRVLEKLLADVEPIVAWHREGDTVTFHEGQCKAVQKDGRTRYELVGDLRRVWVGTDEEPFDQEDDTDDWLEGLDEDQEDETGEGS